MGFVPLANIAKSSSNNVFLPKWSNVDPGKQLVTHSLKFQIPKQKHWCAPHTAALGHFTFSPPSSNCPTKRERDAMGRQMDARLVHVELNPHWMRGINWASRWFYEGSSWLSSVSRHSQQPDRLTLVFLYTTSMHFRWRCTKSCLALCPNQRIPYVCRLLKKMTIYLRIASEIKTLQE